MIEFRLSCSLTAERQESSHRAYDSLDHVVTVIDHSQLEYAVLFYVEKKLVSAFKLL